MAETASRRKGKRPILTRVQPLRLRELLFWEVLHRFFRNRLPARRDLFERVPLEFAPGVTLKLAHTDRGHQAIAYCGFYELSVSRSIAELAKSGGLMVDVGANYGYYSCIWASARPDNRVVAFEPAPKNIVALRHNLEGNRLEKQVTIRAEAAGKEAGTLPFRLGPRDQTGWGALSNSDRSGDITVPVVALDELFAGTGQDGVPQQIDVLKIDTEGADTWVLQGAERLLKAHKVRHVFFEEMEKNASVLGIAPGAARKLLQSYGYQLKRMNVYEWYAYIEPSST